MTGGPIVHITRHLIRRFGALFAVAAAAVLVAACGGGGGDGGSSSSSSSSSNSGSSSGNTAVITVASGVANVINIPTVSVTICAPGTSTC